MVLGAGIIVLITMIVQHIQFDARRHKNKVRYTLRTCYPCLCGSKPHAVFMRQGCVDLIKL